MNTPLVLPLKAAALGLALVLSACGGGSESAGSAPSAPHSAAGTQLQGVVVAGAVSGAAVFLDLNNNQQHDEGEPLTQTQGDQGVFSLAVGARTAGELASATLVAEVPASARDAADGGLTLDQAGRGAYTLMAPASAFIHVDESGRQQAMSAVISPLTTLVAAEVAVNGMTVDEAAQAVRSDLGLEGRDLMANYAGAFDSGLSGIARAAAVALGEPTGPFGTGRRNAIAAARLKGQLATLIKSLNLGSGASGGTPVAAIRQALAAASQSGQPSAEAAAAGSERYIVKLRDAVGDAPERGRRLAAQHRGEVRHAFTRAIKGYAISVPQDQAEAFLEATLRDPDVEHVEIDQRITVAQVVQSNATWGLDRTDQRALPLSGSYAYGDTGFGVRAYIVDTGVRASHLDFEGRVAAGFNAVADGRGTDDCHGHGTHVAGTVGGKTWGMAKGVTLVPVRVLDCRGSGYISTIVAGLDWVVAQGVLPAVANLSLGGTASSSLDAAVARAVAAGVTVAVAAGNDNVNACNKSPAREPSALTVAATTESDARASFSNYGACVDVFGPGASIKSAANTSDTAHTEMSGTSMATPHVAGLAATYLQSHPTATPAAVAGAIKAAATTGKITSRGSNSPDALLYTDLTSVVSVPETPVVPATVSVASLSAARVLASSGWQAKVTVAVKNGSQALVPGALVRGDFTVGGTRLTCTTASNGTCVITSGVISTRKGQTQFSVTGITLAGSTYKSSANAVTSVVIFRR